MLRWENCFEFSGFAFAQLLVGQQPSNKCKTFVNLEILLKSSLLLEVKPLEFPRSSWCHSMQRTLSWSFQNMQHDIQNPTRTTVLTLHGRPPVLLRISTGRVSKTLVGIRPLEYLYQEQIILMLHYYLHNYITTTKITITTCQESYLP